MKRRLHVIALILFVLTLLYDIVLWGALPLIPDVGAAIAASASRESPLAATYVALGRTVDSALPPLGTYGAQHWMTAFDGEISGKGGDPSAMELVFDQMWSQQTLWMKTLYWAPPVLLLLALILWTRRPKTVRVFGARR